MGDLTKHFDRSEFACKCGCGFDDIDLALVGKLEKIRTILDPHLMLVDAGCRCVTHNAEIGGRANSAHLRGKAVDVYCAEDGYRYQLLYLGFQEFTRIEVGSNWIHFDNDKSLSQSVCFLK